jgi:hypothetical protein
VKTPIFAGRTTSTSLIEETPRMYGALQAVLLTLEWNLLLLAIACVSTVIAWHRLGKVNGDTASAAFSVAGFVMACGLVIGGIHLTWVEELENWGIGGPITPMDYFAHVMPSLVSPVFFAQVICTVVAVAGMLARRPLVRWPFGATSANHRKALVAVALILLSSSFLAWGSAVLILGQAPLSWHWPAEGEPLSWGPTVTRLVDIAHSRATIAIFLATGSGALWLHEVWTPEPSTVPDKGDVR